MALLNLPAIETSLRRVQAEFESLNARLSGQHDPMSDAVVENLLAGYTFVDVLIEWDIDIFAKGKHKYLLELNNIVLCGPDQTQRAEFCRHIKATETRFYDEPGGGIEDLVEWRGRPFGGFGLVVGGRRLRALAQQTAAVHRRQPPHRHAAGKLHFVARRQAAVRVDPGKRRGVFRSIDGHSQYQ